VFSAAYNLIAPRKKRKDEPRQVAEPNPADGIQQAPKQKWTARVVARLTGKAPYVSGLAAVILAIVLGNLYQVRVLWNQLPQFAEQRSPDPTWLGQLGDAASGLGRVLSGEEQLLQGDNGLWYFDASRAILNGQDSAPITEFPFFTFLYADLHPHLMDMPLVLAALAWIAAIVRLPAMVSRPWRRQGLLAAGATWLVAGLSFGALYPTNSWDYPVLLALGLAAITYSIVVERPDSWGMTAWRVISRVGLLIGLSIALYTPFHQWFGTGDLSFELWKGPRTPLGDYFTVHGLFLFVILSYMVAETVRWLRPKVSRLIHTPLGEMTSFLENALVAILAMILLLLLAVPWIRRNDYVTASVALLLAAWVGLLLLRPNKSNAQRLAMALVGAGLGLTFIAELVTIKGDVGRMNVVFKFYLLTWLFFSVAAAAVLVWIWPRIWASRRRNLWVGALGLLLLAAMTTRSSARRRRPTIAGQRSSNRQRPWMAWPTCSANHRPAKTTRAPSFTWRMRSLSGWAWIMQPCAGCRRTYRARLPSSKVTPLSIVGVRVSPTTPACPPSSAGTGTCGSITPCCQARWWKSASRN
jgi:uncharacterized membrane protein